MLTYAGARRTIDPLLANHLRALGLQPGDHIAILMDNNLRAVEVAWAALRSGLYITPVNRYLTADEAVYMCWTTAMPGWWCPAIHALASQILDRLPGSISS